MADQLHVEHGSRPWRPTDGSELVAVLDRYDMPTMGIIRQAGRLFVFWCVEGHTSSANLWAYAPIEDAEAEELQRTDFDSAEAFDAHFEELVSRKPVWLVFHRDPEGVLFVVGEVDEQEGTRDLWQSFRAGLRDQVQGSESLHPLG